MANKLVIASAGAGKTTLLVKKALENPEQSILITTFTEASEADIKKKLIEVNGAIPRNVTVQTWFSFLLEHGVRPYQGGVYDDSIRGMLLVSGRSGLKYVSKRGPVYFGEDEFENFYFTKDKKIYSDKLAKFVLRCDEFHNGLVFQRLERCFDYIMIDEVQDLSGYDLEILKLLFNSKIEMLLVGDPRQGTYSTSNAAKNKKFAKSQIVNFFESTLDGLEIDDKSYAINYRCVEAICTLSNDLFPNFHASESGNNNVTGHDGIFLVAPERVSEYLEAFEPMQLRDTVKTKVSPDFEALNFGVSKGLSFQRTLIYPTKPIVSWLKDNDSELKPTSRSKFYVALTRAKQSAAIVCPYSDDLAQKYQYF